MVFGFVAGLILINLTNNSITILIGIGILFAFFLDIIYQKVRTVISPIRLFALDIEEPLKDINLDPRTASANRRKESFKKKQINITDNQKENDPKPVTPQVPTPKETYLFMNETLDFITRLLKTFDKHRLYLIYFCIQIFFTLILSVFIITEINFGIFKVHPEYYTITGDASVFGSFIQYVISTILGFDINIITINSQYPRWFEIFYRVCIYLLTAFVFAYWAQTKSKRFDKNIDKLKGVVEYQKSRLERYILARYRIPAPDLYELLKNNNQLLKFVEKFFKTSIIKQTKYAAATAPKQDKKPFPPDFNPKKRNEKGKKEDHQQSRNRKGKRKN